VILINTALFSIYKNIFLKGDIFMFTRTKKVSSFLLAIATVLILCYNYFISTKTYASMPSIESASIEKISENSVKISYKGSDSIIFSKDREDAKFCYHITDAVSGEDLGSFSSELEINLNSNCVQDFSNCRLFTAANIIWGAIQGGRTPMEAIMAALGNAVPARMLAIMVAGLTEAAAVGGVHGFMIFLGILTSSQGILPILGAIGGVW
jgi:hypothetical protein